jgi:hypothetical protein
MIMKLTLRRSNGDINLLSLYTCPCLYDERVVVLCAHVKPSRLQSTASEQLTLEKTEKEEKNSFEKVEEENID